MGRAPLSLEVFRKRLETGLYNSAQAARQAIASARWTAYERRRAALLVAGYFRGLVTPDARLVRAPEVTTPTLAELHAAHHSLELLQRSAALGLSPELKADLLAASRLVQLLTKKLAAEIIGEDPDDLAELPADPPKVKKATKPAEPAGPDVVPRPDLEEVLKRVERGEMSMTEEQRKLVLVFGHHVLEGEKKKKAAKAE